MSEGVSFDDDLGRFSIIAKCQWPDKADPQIKARAVQDREWYLFVTATNIVQTYGRIVRSDKDWGITYCLDASFKSLYNNSRQYFPHWFREAVIWEGGEDLSSN